MEQTGIEQIFTFEETTKVRTLIIDGRVAFCLTDALLAIKSTTRTADAKDSILDTFGDDVVISYPTIDSLGREQNTIFVYEAGLTFIISRSRTEIGKRFNRWLHTEVLPSIRKTGSYSIKPMSPAELIIAQGQALLELERANAETKAIALRAEATANEAKEGLSSVRDQLASLKEFAVAQPPGLNQDLADQINQAFQLLGATLNEAGIFDKPKCYQVPWKELGLTMRNSSINYDLNARYANALKKYEHDLKEWEAAGKKTKKPAKPTRITVMLRDNVITDAFKGAQQVVVKYLSKV